MYITPNQKNVIYICILILFIYSCGGKKEEALFPAEFVLTHKLYEAEVEGNRGPILLAMDSVLCVISPDMQTDFTRIHSISDEMKEIGRYGTRGRGPGEFLLPIPTSSRRDQFEFHDLNAQEISTIHITARKDSAWAKETVRLKIPYTETTVKIPLTGLFVSRFNTDYFVSIASRSYNEFFTLYDSLLNFICYFGNAPITDKGIDPVNYSKRFQGRIATHKDKIAFMPMNFPVLSFYKMDNGEMVKKWEDKIYEPNYHIEKGDLFFDPETTMMGAITVDVRDTYIYVLFLDTKEIDLTYSDPQTYNPNIVYVWDHYGNRIAKLTLDRRISYMCVSQDEDKIYAIVQTPEWRIAEFKIPNLQK